MSPSLRSWIKNKKFRVACGYVGFGRKLKVEPIAETGLLLGFSLAFITEMFVVWSA